MLLTTDTFTRSAPISSSKTRSSDLQVKNGTIEGKPPSQEQPSKNDTIASQEPRQETSAKEPQSIYSVPSQDLELFEETSSKASIDWTQMSEKLRVFRKMHDKIWGTFANGTDGLLLHEDQSKFYSKVEDHLFPWIKPGFQSTASMRSSFNGDGLILCAGNGQAKMAIATLRMLREVHNSTLPFEVFYIGEGDLSVENRALFEEIPFTATRDITKIFNNDILKLQGWAIKAFALLASSFQNSMLIDADVVFLQSPEILFQSKTFLKHGALFFHDRSLFDHSENTMKWMNDLMSKSLSEYGKSLRVFHKKTAHEMESGVVLINKKSNLPGLLASCFLNVGEVRDKVYQFVFGDKETFWIGFEMVGMDYHFNGHFPGNLGISSLEKDGRHILCARQILHLDETGSPFWINGGITVSKYEENSALIQADSYMTEPGEWQLKENNMACLVVKEEALPLPLPIAQSLRKSGALFDKLRGVGNAIKGINN
jgi:hypothetical protein